MFGATDTIQTMKNENEEEAIINQKYIYVPNESDEIIVGQVNVG